jgi:hypothetical protein
MGAYLKQEISSGHNSARSSSSFFISPFIISDFFFFIYDNPGFFGNTFNNLTLVNSILRPPLLNLSTTF